MKYVPSLSPITESNYKRRVKVKCSSYRPGVAQMVGRGIALLFHDRGTRTGWLVSSTPRPHFTPGKDPVPILKEDGWAPGPVWTGRKSRPHRDSIPDRPARSQSLYRLSYRATQRVIIVLNYKDKCARSFFSVVLRPNSCINHLILRFIDHTQLDIHTHTHKHTGRTPLDKWSARRRSRYLHNTQQA